MYGFGGLGDAGAWVWGAGETLACGFRGLGDPGVWVWGAGRRWSVGLGFGGPQHMVWGLLAALQGAGTGSPYRL